MADRLYFPKELEPTRFLREGERSITGRELCARGAELHAVTGKQFQFLWKLRDEIPESWKQLWGLLVPDSAASVVRVLVWSSFYRRWYRHECTLDDYFHDCGRVLVPRE